MSVVPPHVFLSCRGKTERKLHVGVPLQLVPLGGFVCWRRLFVGGDVGEPHAMRAQPIRTAGPYPQAAAGRPGEENDRYPGGGTPVAAHHRRGARPAQPREEPGAAQNLQRHAQA